MKRNFEKMVNEGAALAERTGRTLYADEMQALHEKAAGEWDIMQRAYFAGLAAGYRIRKQEDAAKRKKAAERAAKKEAKDRRALLLEVGAKLGYRPDEIEMALEYAASEGGQA